jgi:hypothetical protein
MSEAPVLATVEGAVGIIELARPQIFNCLSSSPCRACASRVGLN